MQKKQILLTAAALFLCASWASFTNFLYCMSSENCENIFGYLVMVKDVCKKNKYC